MPDTQMATDAKQFASKHSISIGKIIEIGSHVISAVISFISGQAVDETFQIRIHGQKFNGHVLVQLTPPRVLLDLEPAP